MKPDGFDAARSLSLYSVLLVHLSDKCLAALNMNGCNLLLRFASVMHIMARYI